MKLKEVMSEMTPYEYSEDKAYRFRDVEVTKIHSKIGVNGGKIVGRRYKKWIGKQKYVHFWVELANGYAVGMNENPSRGITFPVVRMKK